MTQPKAPAASSREGRIRRADLPLLRARLDAQYESFNFAESATDPIQIVRRYPHPADREVVGFCAAALAFGRVASVLQSIERLMEVLGPAPATFVREFDPTRDGRAIRPLIHRWTRGDDLVALLIILQQMLRSGSIEHFFAEGLDPAAADLSGALESFSTRALAVDVREAYGNRKGHPGVAYFFPKPSTGSGCKRMNLFLRWMVRKDGVDLGVWSSIPAFKLIVPLDTHVIRLGRCLRLTTYASPGWKMAAQITESLRALDPVDPVKYDFSLCHIGMSDQCGFRRSQRDSVCPLKGFCKPRASAPPSARR
jgi:uncharacterized protein (TIGR02757 family)